MEQFTTFGRSAYPVGDLQLFHGSSQADIAALLADCPVLRVPAAQTLDAANDRDGRLYIVLRGALVVEHADAQAGRSDGGSTRVLPGECIGELSVLDGEASADRISALADSDVLAIDATTLWKLIDESNDVARNLLRLLSFRIRAANAQLRRRQKVGEFYRQLSMVDGLTGLQNRAWLNDRLPDMIAGAEATHSPLSIIMVDLDNFKRFNDVHGHVSGDHALQVAARVIRAGLRPTDFAVRFGGEELLVILPATHRNGAQMAAQRLCENLRRAVVFSEPERQLPHITASLGVATLETGQHAEALISAADAALYRAKENGRDCVAL